MARYGPLWQFPARKTAAGTDCGTQPARGAGTAGVGQSVGLWLGILPQRAPTVPSEPSPPIPINITAPAQPETRTEQGLFCCAGNRRRGAKLPRRAPPAPAEPSPANPHKQPSPRPAGTCRTERGLWRLGYAEGAEVSASVSRTSTRRVISRLQVKRVISHSPASRVAGSSASISVIPVT